MLAGLALSSGRLQAEPAEEAPSYQFDSGFLMGSSLGAGGLERFNKVSTVDPGVYQVDVFVNGAFRSRKAVEFRAGGKEVVPCLEDAFLIGAGVLAANLAPADAGAQADGAQGAAGAVCLPLGQRVAGARATFDLPRLRLDLSIAQALMKRAVRGAVDKGELDPGVPAGFVNYDTNYFRASNSGSASESMYLGMNFGANAGMWRLRQQ
ncbi:MAG TPA: FimD/PapC N-terminal domain-containing protein, partial [Variovorax sp.]|nr:FimD/PapC N-terminal domain-containing protein [Variovorax sp.]